MQNNFDESGLVGIERSPSIWARLVGWWYRLAAPAASLSSASFEERDVIRRARLASVIILIVLIGNIPSLPPAINGPNKILLPILGVQFLVTLLAAYLNKKRRVNIAGVLVVLVLAAGMMGNITSSAGGITTQAVPLFALLTIPEIVAAAMLPMYWVFIVALLDVAFSLFAVTYLHAPHLSAQDLSFIYSYGVFLTATIQVIIAGVSFLWNISLSRALRAQDQAEEIARLERDLSDQSMLAMEQKAQLEQSIELIVQTQARVANGDLQARVPLTQDNVLWSVGGTLNNLISRLQRSRGVERELEVTKNSAVNFVMALRAYKAGVQARRYSRSGTVIDLIAVEVLPPENVTHPLDHPTSQHR